jgi:hypothetical protein
MVRLEPTRTGFALGTFSGVMALLWIALVLTGVASRFLNFFLSLNFVLLPVDVAPFEFSKAFSILGLAIGLGFFAGLGFAGIWNYYRRY